MRVLYEGGLLSGKKYTSIRNTKDVVKESGKNCKNKKIEFMKNCEREYLAYIGLTGKRMFCTLLLGQMGLLLEGTMLRLVIMYLVNKA